jgi:hypothetical protein
MRRATIVATVRPLPGGRVEWLTACPLRLEDLRTACTPTFSHAWLRQWLSCRRNLYEIAGQSLSCLV